MIINVRNDFSVSMHQRTCYHIKHKQMKYKMNTTLLLEHSRPLNAYLQIKPGNWSLFAHGRERGRKEKKKKAPEKSLSSTMTEISASK